MRSQNLTFDKFAQEYVQKLPIKSHKRCKNMQTQDFEQTHQNVARLHDRTTVTFRSSEISYQSLCCQWNIVEPVK